MRDHSMHINLHSFPRSHEQLTNAQAETIASSSDNVQLMLKALDVRKPSLVIELLSSGGFRDYTTQIPSAYMDRAKHLLGVVHNLPPFLSDEEEREAESKIDLMMAEVIIPLAAENHAVVLCDPCSGANCVLSASFLRMYSAMKAKWSGPPPFTVICVTTFMGEFYQNLDENAHWRTVRQESKTWRQRDAKLEEIFGFEHYLKEKGPGFNAADSQMYFDLDPRASCIIMADNIDPKLNTGNAKPITSLGRELVRYLSNSFPSIVIKTGFSGTPSYGAEDMTGLAIVSARAQAGTPVLGLDVRNRLPLSFAPGTDPKARRKALIEHAKTQISDWRAKLLEEKEGKPPLAETFEMCTLAFLNEALKGDGEASDSKKRKNKLTMVVPLHEAIRRAEDEESSVKEGDGSLPAATPTQIAELARWHTNGVFSDAWHVYKGGGGREEREARGDTVRSLFGDKRSIQEMLSRLLLGSHNFYNVNLNDMEVLQKKINQIVRLDRLPASNPFQGLLLLRDAWRDYDVATLLAGRYKMACKVLFALQLFIGWLVVIGAGAYADEISEGHNLHAVFALAVIFSMLVSLDGMLNPKVRWRQLRSSAMSLQSIIWQCTLYAISALRLRIQNKPMR